MRLTILRMISANSLAAFSNSNAVQSTNRTAALRQVRSLTDQAQASASPTQAQAGKPAGGITGAAPGRIMPRGSLLDLSV